MDFFERGFLSEAPEFLTNGISEGYLSIAVFMLIAVVALEMSRRIDRFGVPLAIIMIVGTGLYMTGALEHVKF